MLYYKVKLADRRQLYSYLAYACTPLRNIILIFGFSRSTWRNICRLDDQTNLFITIIISYTKAYAFRNSVKTTSILSRCCLNCKTVATKVNIYPLVVRNTINQISLHCYQILTTAKCNIKVIPVNKFSHALIIVQVYSRYFTIKVNNRALHNIFIGYSIYITYLSSDFRLPSSPTNNNHYTSLLSI